MKNVIVGIDFSKGSVNAMQHAVSIAAKYKAKMTLLFVISPTVENLIEEKVSKSNIVPHVEKKLKELVADCKKMLPRNVVESKIRIGKVWKELNTEAVEQGNALIVVGTHGCSDFQEFFIGSRAFKTINYSQCPVLTVREGIDIQRDLTDILLIIDDTMETLQKLRHAASMAKAFQAKVHILGLYPPGYPDIRRTIDAYVNRAEVFMMEHNVRLGTVFVEVSKKLDTVLEYALKNDVNLIIVMKEVELKGDTALMASFSQKIVNRSPIPILTVNVDESIYP